jgi:hypothetical protein
MARAAEQLQEKLRAHGPYFNKAGLEVVSLTTFLDVLSRPKLIRWAHDLGRAGIDYDAYMSDLGDVGTLAHRLCLQDLRGVPAPYDEYSKNVRDRAETCFIKFLDWKKRHHLEPLSVEKPILSEQYQYGCTPDFYGRIDGRLNVMEIKTGSAIYDDTWEQVAGQRLALIELGVPVEEARILRISRLPEEGFEEAVRQDPLHSEEIIVISARRIWEERFRRPA